MKLDITVTEVNDLIKVIQEGPERLFEMMRSSVKHSVGEYLSELMNDELTGFLGRKYYERIEDNTNHRNGSYGREFTLKGIGKVSVKVPRDRKGRFHTQVIPRSKQYEDSLREDMCAMFLAGVSTRTLSIMSERLIGRKISPSEISKASGSLSEAVEAWRQRDLSTESFKYIFVDGVIFSMRIDGSIEKVPVLVAIGSMNKAIVRYWGYRQEIRNRPQTGVSFSRI